MFNIERLELGNQSSTRKRIEKAISLIIEAAEVTYQQKNGDTQMQRNDDQLVRRHIDAGTLHVTGRLLAAEGCADGERYGIGFTGYRREREAGIVAHEGQDLAEPAFGQVAHKVNARVSQASDDSRCEFCFHKIISTDRYFSIEGCLVNRSG